MKRTHKFRSLGDVDAIVRQSSSVADAAKRLGVDRGTVNRWILSGKVSKPGTASAPAVKADAPVEPQPASGHSPEAWATWARQRYVLDETQEVLLDQAVQSALLAKDVTQTALVRLSAMGRYQNLVKQLNFEGHSASAGKAQPSRFVRQEPRKVSGDPRALLQAVK